MSVEAHRCNVKECKGFVLFENADFDFTNKPLDEKIGCYVFAKPTCSECGKEYLVVPHYVVIDVKDNDVGSFDQLESACMTDWERRERERKFESETDPHTRIQMFLIQRGYTYTVAEVTSEYLKYQKEKCYLSHSMKECISNLESEIKSLL
ncbi:hypothetical protein ACFVS2_26140 [Brevibacillus sp. NPDC058079]|uniref:hypothetical protein n=1 Tax=Brevibacillus sp. NPDC058079 TaxID=3346330 RepID=UPI0036E5F6EA